MLIGNYPSASEYLKSALVDERLEVGLPLLVGALEPHREERHLRPHERHVFVLGLREYHSLSHCHQLYLIHSRTEMFPNVK